jgi:NAD(P)-dependent dehydrogenase (short-subunit alcohol dehydrogenase family)
VGGRWTARDVPDQSGRTAVVTGANSGIGFATAAVLAARGARVVLACRSRERGRAAADRIRVASPDAELAVAEVDLGDLASVRAAADRLRADHPRIDLLINNAGVLEPPQARTVDGFETHLGVNHLGAFALTGMLIERLVEVAGSRVVAVSSFSHRFGRIHRDDLQLTGRHSSAAAYAQSKLANLLFTYELQRRLAAAGAATIAVAAHPGNARTEVARSLGPVVQFLADPRLSWLTRWVVQPAAIGALGVLRAATDPAARGGDFFGPRRFIGHPLRIESSPASHDEQVAAWLWAESERLTGVAFRLDATRSG